MTFFPLTRTRICVRCHQPKPLRGGATRRDGKGWRCKDCRPKPAPERAAA